MPDLTAEEVARLLAEIEGRNTEDEPNCFTVPELIDHMEDRGVSPYQVRKGVQKMRKAGVIEPARIRRVVHAGHVQHVAGYRFTDAA